jgi:hypothetical protein
VHRVEHSHFVPKRYFAEKWDVELAIIPRRVGNYELNFPRSIITKDFIELGCGFVAGSGLDDLT